MSLRVFKSGENSLAVEISSPRLTTPLKWFIPIYPEGAAELQNLNPADSIKVTYDGKPFYALFLLIRTVKIMDDSELVAVLLPTKIRSTC